ncbi:hypothetical protein GTP56_05900 [Duganella sp. FT134W]|uniref:Uncharacterized protein n=1 Tax=Duganella margarita TaxID=2692170 RepID=A0A7X4GXZ4_9BURK|nr:hypothetical protein [Duganella margarita]MYM71730.1 hypothetical protein [Duganella margarita]
MARYYRLLALEVTHEFIGHAAVQGLRYVPTAETAAVMAREGLVWRSLPTGVELWQEWREDIASAALWQLSLDVHTGDGALMFYTEWPQAGLAVTPGAQGAVKVLRAMAQRAGAGAAAALWIDLALQPLMAAQAADDAAQAVTVRPWRFALQSRKVHWKYFFSGGLAAKQLSIIDLDGSDSQPGLAFEAAPLAATVNGTAYLSAAPVPMQSFPPQRLQLREAGVAGKVLIRRLPNASVDRLGKERGPNGQSMIVAEIYVHQ